MMYGLFFFCSTQVLAFKGMLQLGSVPEVPSSNLHNLTPVDFVSEAIAHISLGALRQQRWGIFSSYSSSSTSSLPTYNVVNPAKSVPLQDIIADLREWAKEHHQHQIKMLPYNMWLDELRQAPPDNALHPLRPILEASHPDPSFPASPSVRCDNLRQFYSVLYSSARCNIIRESLPIVFDSLSARGCSLSPK